jgi:hypothetical protein
MFISAMCEFVGLIYLQMSMSASSRVKRECASAYASTHDCQCPQGTYGDPSVEGGCVNYNYNKGQYLYKHTLE